MSQFKVAINSEVIGKIINEGVYNEKNVLLVQKGTSITEGMCSLLKKHGIRMISVSRELLK